jgi:hypothetical protein
MSAEQLDRILRAAQQIFMHKTAAFTMYKDTLIRLE